MHITAIVPAAGGGTRMGTDVPKQYLRLTGIPLLARTLMALRAVRCLDCMILAIPPTHEDRCRREILDPYDLSVDVLVPGGADRQASVYAGVLQAPPATDLFLVHDGARPFIAATIVNAAVRAAAESGGAVVAVPVTDTIKIADDAGFVAETPERKRLWAAQTPQVFRADLFREAHRLALRDGFRTTDDSALVERLGHPVRLVQGSPENIKITTLADLALAEQILREREMTKSQ